MIEPKDNEIVLVEDFLPMSIAERIHGIMADGLFPWYYNPSNVAEDIDNNIKASNNFYFNHVWYKDNLVNSEQMNYELKYIQKEIEKLIGKNNLYRIKANLYTNQGNQIEYGKHIDILTDEFFWTAIYNVNTCNGYTVFDDKDKNINEKLLSVKNQLILFDGRIQHYAVTQDDTNERIVINFVYEK